MDQILDLADDDVVTLTEEKLNCNLCDAEISAVTRVNFGCLHCYCKSCVEAQFNVAIKYSNLQSLKCPHPRCPAKALPNLIEGILSKELYEKYVVTRPGARTRSASSRTSKQGHLDMDRDIALIAQLESEDGNGDGNNSTNSTSDTEMDIALIALENDDGDGNKPNNSKSNDVELDNMLPGNPIENYDDNTEFECPICFDTFTIGTDFGCGHKHCKACIKVYLETKIQDGSIYKIKCPAMIDCEFEADPATIQENVSMEMYTKYDEALLSDLLARVAPEVVNCPNAWCQQRIVADPEYGYCPTCDFRFCTECNQAYHGVAACSLTEEERKEKIRKYIEATENERRELERQEELKRKKHIEESDNLIKTLCKKCPNCVANIQKDEGCNHMHCIKCSTHFCWLCLEMLDSKDPYAHFNTGSLCSLFEISNDDSDESLSLSEDEVDVEEYGEEDDEAQVENEEDEDEVDEPQVEHEEDEDELDEAQVENEEDEVDIEEVSDEEDDAAQVENEEDSDEVSDEEDDEAQIENED